MSQFLIHTSYSLFYKIWKPVLEMASFGNGMNTKSEIWFSAFLCCCHFRKILHCFMEYLMRYPWPKNKIEKNTPMKSIFLMFKYVNIFSYIYEWRKLQAFI